MRKGKAKEGRKWGKEGVQENCTKKRDGGSIEKVDEVWGGHVSRREIGKKRSLN